MIGAIRLWVGEASNNTRLGAYRVNVNPTIKTIDPRQRRNGRNILFSGILSATIYKPNRGFLIRLATLLIAAAFLISRDPNHLLHPWLWAEDGDLVLQEAYDNGAATLLWPDAGYLVTFPRLVALGALFLPFTAIPLAFVIVALCIQLLPALLLLSARAEALIPSASVRLILVAFYIAEPGCWEIYLTSPTACGIWRWQRFSSCFFQNRDRGFSLLWIH